MSERNFEPETYWKTTGGYKARVIGRMENGNVVIECDDDVIVLSPEGIAASGFESPVFSLVEPWREPARVMVTLYRNIHHGNLCVFNEPVEFADVELIGTVWAIEGQFAEGTDA